MRERTLDEAVELTGELWTWLLETGAEYKDDWPEWYKYGYTNSHCFLCEYTWQKGGEESLPCTTYCPLAKGKRMYECQKRGQPYYRWRECKTKAGRQRNARKLLDMLEVTNGC